MTLLLKDSSKSEDNTQKTNVESKPKKKFVIKSRKRKY